MWFILIIIGLFSPFINCNDKPLLQELLVPKNLEENQTIRLMCGIVKGESIQFFWYKDNQKLEDRNRRKIKYNEESSELLIKSLSIDDLGEYKCSGINKFGEDSQKVSLYFNVKPKWTIEHNDVMSSLSKEVILECKSIGYQSPFNKWIKLSDDKKTIIKEFQQSDTIKFELTKETSGYYRCESSNSIGSIEKIINVGYYDDGPTIESLFTSPYLIEGRKFSITCQVNNSPDNLIFEWYLNERKIVPNENIVVNQHEDNSQLNIKKMNLEYSGEYTCKVSNSLGVQDSKSILVKLNVKPRWTVEPIDIQTKLNAKLITKCEANGIPKPKIKWIKLSSNGENEFIIDNNELEFQNFTKSDASNYKCVAENDLGKIEKTIKLTYYVNCNDKPILHELLTTKNLAENQTIRILCSLIQGESVEFQWYKNNERLTESDKRKILFNGESSELVIKSLSIDDLGDYKCVASNRNGKDLQSVSLYFNVKPKWIVEPNNVLSSLFKEINLECKSNGYPLPINKWIKLSDDKKTIIKEFQSSDAIKFELTKETSGYYRCESSNSIGSIEKIINVGYYGK